MLGDADFGEWEVGFEIWKPNFNGTLLKQFVNTIHVLPSGDWLKDCFYFLFENRVSRAF
jgi:hypothetical protein